MRLSRVKFSLILLLGTVAGGCAGGPFDDVAEWNPYYRSAWERDELAGPTFHTKLKELRALRRNPTGLSPEEQQQMIPTLAGIVSDSTNAVLRAEATLTLAEFATAEVIPTLQLAMDDPDADVRAAACKAWGRRGGPEAIGLLSKAVRNDSDLDVRLVATTELAKFQEQQSLESLAIALNDKDPALQHRAVQSLKSVSGQDYGNNIPAWRDFVEGRSPALPEPPTIADRIRSMSWF
jgi:HEAT repeats